MRRGGDNNDKGSRYEALYAAYLIAKYEAEGLGQETSISAQEEAWVDDLCVRAGDQRKINYQAKNSDGDAASWDAEMEERFGKQQVIDIDYHRVADAKQVLLVSCEDKCLKNQEKIPEEMTGFASCEFYPFVDQPTQILLSHDPTYQAVAGICEGPNLDDMSAAFVVIMGLWADQPSGSPIGVSDLINQAKRITKPNVFKEIAQPEPPQWLLDIIAPFPFASIKVQSGDFMVGIRGLSVRLPGSLAHEPAPDVQAVSGELELVELLFRLSSHAQL